MPQSERKFWPRPGTDAHVLGEIKSVMVGEHEVRALMLYERAVIAVPVILPALRGRVIGGMDAIRCTECGKTHDWIIGEDAMLNLVEKILGPDGVERYEQIKRGRYATG